MTYSLLQWLNEELQLEDSDESTENNVFDDEDSTITEGKVFLFSDGKM